MQKFWWGLDAYNRSPLKVADSSATKEEAVQAAFRKGLTLVSHRAETREEYRRHISSHNGTDAKKGYGFH